MRFCHHFQSSCSPNVRDGPMSAKGSWGNAEDEGSEQIQGPQPTAEPERGAQRRFRSSAFASSLSWDSDSEKEALDGNRQLRVVLKTCCIFLKSRMLGSDYTAELRGVVL